jgi:hypothetical protein
MMFDLDTAATQPFGAQDGEPVSGPDLSGLAPDTGVVVGRAAAIGLVPTCWCSNRPSAHQPLAWALAVAFGAELGGLAWDDDPNTKRRARFQDNTILISCGTAPVRGGTPPYYPEAHGPAAQYRPGQAHWRHVRPPVRRRRHAPRHGLLRPPATDPDARGRGVPLGRHAPCRRPRPAAGRLLPAGDQLGSFHTWFDWLLQVQMANRLPQPKLFEYTSRHLPVAAL